MKSETTGQSRPDSSDRHLLAAIAEAMAAVDAHAEKWAEVEAAREKAEADPACPPREPGASSDAHFAFLHRSPWGGLCDEAAALDIRARGLTWAAFRAKPNTLRGLQFKVAFNSYLECTVEDDNLENWPHAEDWPGEELAWDLENLGGGLPLELPEDLGSLERPAGTASLIDAEDPFVALWSERVAKKAEADELARASKDPECDEACGRVLDVDKEIEATPARTLFGILVKLRVFLNIQEIADEFGGERPALGERLFRGAIADLELLIGAAS